MNRIDSYIVSLAALLAAASCSHFTSQKTSTIKALPEESAAITAEPQVEPIAEFPVKPFEASAKEQAKVTTPDNTTKKRPEDWVHIPIDDFSREQQQHVVIAEFSDHAKFQDLALTYKQLSDERFRYPADGYITSPFGWRGSRMHNGIDIKAYYKDPIYAAFDGVVRMASYNGAFGNCIVIRHYNGLETVYAHATRILVKPNQRVCAGDKIALAGSTGRATGVHLHFEVRIVGQPIDPNLLLDTKNRKLKQNNLYATMRSGRLFASANDDKVAREREIQEILAVKYHTVRSGDTLSRIARNNSTTITALCRLNNISSRSILRIGQRVRVK